MRYILINYIIPKKHLSSKIYEIEQNRGYHDEKLKSQYFQAYYIRSFQLYYTYYMKST